MRHRCTVAAAILALGLVGGAQAEQAVALLGMGGVCREAPQGAKPAPETRDGVVTTHKLPYDFIVPGKVVPGAVDMGVGLVLQLQDFVPGETLTLEGQLLGVDPKPDRWTQTLRPDGILWFGFMPTPKLPIDLGTYRFRVLRGNALLFAQDIRVKRATPGQMSLCHPETS